MAKAAIVLLADTETPEGTGRMANALTTAREFAEAGDEVRVVFDGAGVKWVPVLLDEGHKYRRLLESVRPHVDGACAYCARAYGVKDALEEADFPLTVEYRDHPSLRTLIVDGYEGRDLLGVQRKSANGGVGALTAPSPWAGSGQAPR